MSLASTAGGATMNHFLFSLIVFLICTAIGCVAIIAGTGGGVLFTTLFLGFTSIHPDIIRATGLLAALSGTRMGARRFLRKGIANIRLVILLGFGYSLFAVLGAIVGLEITQKFGSIGVAFIKAALGFVVIIVGVIYLFARGANYPVVEKVDWFTEKLGLSVPYYEESRKIVVNYKLTKSYIGLILICVVGFISGTFGLGAGWAITPLLNLVMMAPLKVAVASSAVMISIGDTAAVFPYLMSNSIIPLFAVPAVLGLMVGAEIGSRLAVRIRARFIRYVLIVIMLGTGLELIYKGFHLMGIV